MKLANAVIAAARAVGSSSEGEKTEIALVSAATLCEWMDTCQRFVEGRAPIVYGARPGARPGAPAPDRAELLPVVEELVKATGELAIHRIVFEACPFSRLYFCLARGYPMYIRGNREWVRLAVKKMTVMMKEESAEIVVKDAVALTNAINNTGPILLYLAKSVERPAGMFARCRSALVALLCAAATIGANAYPLVCTVGTFIHKHHLTGDADTMSDDELGMWIRLVQRTVQLAPALCRYAQYVPREETTDAAIALALLITGAGQSADVATMVYIAMKPAWRDLFTELAAFANAGFAKAGAGAPVLGQRLSRGAQFSLCAMWSVLVMSPVACESHFNSEAIVNATCAIVASPTVPELARAAMCDTVALGCRDVPAVRDKFCDPKFVRVVARLLGLSFTRETVQTDVRDPAGFAGALLAMLQCTAGEANLAIQRVCIEEGVVAVTLAILARCANPAAMSQATLETLFSRVGGTVLTTHRAPLVSTLVRLLDALLESTSGTFGADVHISKETALFAQAVLREAKSRGVYTVDYQIHIYAAHRYTKECPAVVEAAQRVIDAIARY